MLTIRHEVEGRHAIRDRVRALGFVFAKDNYKGVSFVKPPRGMMLQDAIGTLYGVEGVMRAERARHSRLRDHTWES